MRDDMFKVIVERPRLIHGNWLGGGREPGFRQRMARDDVPAKVGMRASHDNRKWLNENLTPLRRFLEQQVGRPWDKVHAELLRGIDQRNTVQQHILKHIDNFVHLDARAEPRIDAKGRQRGIRFMVRDWRGHAQPVEESWRPLFVDPRTGLLRATGASACRARQRRAKVAAAKQADLAVRRVISNTMELRRHDHVWYEVTVAPTPGTRVGDWRYARLTEGERRALPHAYDCLLKREVNCNECATYVTAKRQLGHRELRQHGLRA